MKKVIAQKQIWHEYGYQNYLESFKGISELTVVSVIPFTNNLEPDIDFIPDVVMGSGRLVRIARERGWPTFPSFGAVDFSIFESCEWFNGDGWETTIGDFDFKDNDLVFIKPFTEKLCQSGLVDTSRDLMSQLQFTKMYDEILTEKIWVSEPKQLNDEFRFFIIGGKLITGSLYKQNNEGSYANINSEHLEWLAAQDILNNIMVDNFTGVMDITFCKTRNHWYIVELNNLNSSGVYHCDYDILAKTLVNFIN